LADCAETLPERIEILEVLVKTHPFLNSLGPEFINWMQLLMSPLRMVWPEHKRARRKGWWLSRHDFRDIVVQSLVVHISTFSQVAVHQDLHLALAQILDEWEKSVELSDCDLATAARIWPRWIGHWSVHYGIEDVLQGETPGLAQCGNAVQNVHNLVFVLNGIGSEGAHHCAARRRCTLKGIWIAFDVGLINHVTELVVVHHLRLLNLRAVVSEVLAQQVSFLVRQACEIQGRDGSLKLLPRASAAPQVIEVIEEFTHTDAPWVDENLDPLNDVTDDSILVHLHYRRKQSRVGKRKLKYVP